MKAYTVVTKPLTRPSLSVGTMRWRAATARTFHQPEPSPAAKKPTAATHGAQPPTGAAPTTAKPTASRITPASIVRRRPKRRASVCTDTDPSTPPTPSAMNTSPSTASATPRNSTM